MAHNPGAFIAILALVLLSGCAGPIAAVGSAASAALQVVGLSKPEIPDDQKPPREVRLHLQAGSNLNSDDKGREQAAVVRIYQLKDASSFWLAPYDAFVQPHRDRAMLGSNMIDVKELTLAPGQSYDVIEKVPRQVKALAVVTLFYSPAPQRWRIVFDAQESEKTGILVGIHSCAMTATRGSILPSQAPGQAALPSPAWDSLLAVNCSRAG